MIKDFLGKKWFFEGFVPGEPTSSTWGFLIKKKIYSGKSDFQKIEIFEAEEFGRILVLDNLIQLSTKDEFTYHEMLVHPAMISVNNPQKVLIIGGGDGGALREVVKYSVKEIFLVDIDKKVVEVCQKFLPSVSQGAFQDKRVKVFYQDAFKFIKNYHHYFDVIIDDLTDPSGPSLFLWQSKFYRNIAQALAPKGIASFQTGYLKEKFALKARKEIKKIFPYFKSYKAFVRCFPFDEHTFSLASKDLNFSLISFNLIEEKFKKIKIKTKYYSPKIQFCSEI